MAGERVNSLAKGLMILESFVPGSFKLSLAKLSKMTNTPKTTAYRLLNTLTDLRYLKYDPRYKEYYLGPKVLSLGYAMLQSMEIRDVIRPYLEELSNGCNKTVGFAILDDAEMVYIERIRAPDVLYLDITIGTRIPCYATAAGKAVLANIPEEKLADILETIKSDPNSAPFVGDGHKFVQSLKEIKKTGYSLSDEEYRQGIRAIAAPVSSFEGVLGAVNMVVAGSLVSVDELKDRYAPMLVKMAKEISDALGHRSAMKLNT